MGSRGMALVMEDTGGRVLCDILRATGLDLRTTLEVAIALAAILDSLHQRRIVHRDVKPHNVLLDLESKAIWLIDFGISARLVQEIQVIGSPESLEDTLAYISPEQTGRTSRVEEPALSLRPRQAGQPLPEVRPIGRVGERLYHIWVLDLAAPMMALAGAMPIVDMLPFYAVLSMLALPDAAERERRGAAIAAH
jgi:serine/threonine protein kinase